MIYAPQKKKSNRKQEKYFFSGDYIKALLTYEVILDANKALAHFGEDIRLGSDMIDVSERALQENIFIPRTGRLFIPGVYVPESKLKTLNQPPKNKFSLKQGLYRIKKTLDSLV